MFYKILNKVRRPTFFLLSLTLTVLVLLFSINVLFVSSASPAAPDYVGGGDADGSTNSGTGNLNFTRVFVQGDYAYIAKNGSSTDCSSAAGCELQVWQIGEADTGDPGTGASTSGVILKRGVTIKGGVTFKFFLPLFDTLLSPFNFIFSLTPRDPSVPSLLSVPRVTLGIYGSGFG
jgi:hypothetical protein